MLGVRAGDQREPLRGAARRAPLHARPRLHPAGHADQHDGDLRLRASASTRPTSPRCAPRSSRRRRGPAAPRHRRPRALSTASPPPTRRRSRSGSASATRSTGLRTPRWPSSRGPSRCTARCGPRSSATTLDQCSTACSARADRGWLRDWSVHFVRGGGRCPRCSSGAQPYGLLPVSHVVQPAGRCRRRDRARRAGARPTSAASGGHGDVPRLDPDAPDVPQDGTAPAGDLAARGLEGAGARPASDRAASPARSTRRATVLA